MESGLFASQRPLWIGQQLHRSSPLYNMAFAFVLEGKVDADAFCRAWARVVGSSDALRSTFCDSAGTPVRTLLPPPGPATRLLDLSSGSDPVAAFHALAQDAYGP